MYEYRVQRSGGLPVPGIGYTVVGVAGPMVENRGTLTLIVDQTKAAALSFELGRLEQDLVGDGWKVIRHDVAPDVNDTGASVAAVKALIQADYNADPTNVKSVFLFGDIPIPYSGLHSPDTHVSAYHAGGRLLWRCCGRGMD